MDTPTKQTEHQHIEGDTHTCACGWNGGIHEVSHLHIESPDYWDREKQEYKAPHIWIQWKGTDVCADIHCECGAHLHVDVDFFYYFRCGRCRRVYEVGTHVPIYEVRDSRADKEHVIDVPDTGD